MVLVCISLMITDAEHIFMYLLAISRSFWKNVYLISLHILNQIFAVELYEFYIYEFIFLYWSLIRSMICNFFYSIGCLSFWWYLMNLLIYFHSSFFFLFAPLLKWLSLLCFQVNSPFLPFSGLILNFSMNFEVHLSYSSVLWFPFGTF